MELPLQPRSRVECESPETYRMDEKKRPQIVRKPVSARAPETSQSKEPLRGSSDTYGPDAPDYLSSRIRRLDLEGTAPVLPPRPEPLFIETTTLSHSNERFPTQYEQAATPLSYTPSDGSFTASKPILSPATSTSSAAAYTQKAYREVRHFAGGLIHHPSQSTKHFSILRHSHGLIFYQGPTNTTLALSIFADRPLPTDRTLWLQSKGWTGNAGMRAGTMLASWNSTARWMDVTPTMQVPVEELQPADERAWQRDIAKFGKRAARDKRAAHRLRETVIVRIPAGARDGYYRVVLCTGGGEASAASNKKRKMLCPSPVFRVLSTSTSPGSVRGAGLTTLPLEIGAMVLTSAAKTAARTATGNTVAPVAAVVQQQIQPYKPSWAMQTAAKAAYNVSGASKRIDSKVQNADQLYDQKRREEFGDAINRDMPEEGPQEPFPIEFVGLVDYRSSLDEDFDVPITYLTKIPKEISKTLNGYYFGWVKSNDKKKNRSESSNEYDGNWQKAIISAIPQDLITSSPANIVEKDHRSIAIYLVQDEKEPVLFDAQVQVQVMGFIRLPDQFTGQVQISGQMDDMRETEAENALLSAVNDIEIAQAFLDSPAWAPKLSLSHKEPGSARPSQRITNSYADTRLSLQKQIDRVPFHRAGIRMPSHAIREQGVGTSGVYVIR